MTKVELVKKILLEDLKYHIFYKVIDACHVVPQNRKRIFIGGFDSPIKFEFPDFPESNLTIKDILDKEVDPKYTLTNHLWEYLQKYAEKHKEKGNGFGYGLVNPDGIARTLSARYDKDGAEILIPQVGTNPRRLTPREYAKLMGFPENFIIPVSDHQAYKQFGNAVVPLVVKARGKEILNSLNRKTLVEPLKKLPIVNQLELALIF